MSEFAVGAAFIKAHRSIMRIVPLKSPCRYFAVRDSAGMITLPSLDFGQRYIELQGIQQAGFKVDNSDKEFRLLGDSGWSDSVTTGGRVSMNASTFFMRNVEMPATGECPVFKGDYEEGYAQIERARYDQDYEVYVELLKEMGRADGDVGNFIYDFAGFNGAIRNYNEPIAADDLVQVTFDVMSRGRPVFGRYDAGSTALPIGEIQTSLLTTSSSTGNRRYAVVPALNATGIVVGANVTITYTSNGTIALTQLALGQADGGGFVLENASSGVVVPSVVSLNAGTGVVTINPVADLAAGTIFRVVVRDGAITQAVDGSGAASPTGSRKGLQGFTTAFVTAP
jgi:hypothetical protein